MTFRGADPAEALALARLACQVHGEDEHAEGLRAVDARIALAQQRHAAAGDPFAALPAALAAQLVAGTAAASA
jgi:hypothetical protein